MIMTGKRNPFENDYQVGFDNKGVIHSLMSVLYSDSGAYADLSTSIMERAMLHSDNAYYIENINVVGQVCKTNHHPHTAFRGFGGPAGWQPSRSSWKKLLIILNWTFEVRK